MAAADGTATAKAAGPGSGPHAERAQRLAEQILASTAGLGLRAGGRLPTERQLSIDLGVTRSAVRHAMAVLEAQGRISREVGRGTFLRDGDPGAGPHRGDGSRPGWTMAPPSADFAPADVMTIRRLLEPPAMSLVVSWATAADLQEMQRCLAGGDGAATFEEFEGLGPGPAPVHHRRKPQSAARRAVPGDRGGPARPGLGRPQAPEHDARAPGPLPGRPPCHRRGAAGPGLWPGR